MLATGCSTPSERRCAFNAIGPEVDALAPGEEILVPVLGSHTAYRGESGTSLSVPFVVAEAAARWSLKPTLNASAVFESIKQSIQNLNAQLPEPGTGVGEIGIGCALESVLGCRFRARSLQSALTLEQMPETAAPC